MGLFTMEETPASPHDPAKPPATEPKKEEPPAPGPAKHEDPPPRAAKDDEQRLLAAFSYLGILFVIPLLFGRSEFCKFHVRQGMTLFLIDVILSFGFLHPVVGSAVGLLISIMAIFAIVRTLMGAKWELPLVGKYAQKIKL